MAYLWGQLIPMDGNTVSCCENNGVKDQNGNDLRLCSAIDKERVQADDKKKQKRLYISSFADDKMFGDNGGRVDTYITYIGSCYQHDGSLYFSEGETLLEGKSSDYVILMNEFKNKCGTQNIIDLGSFYHRDNFEFFETDDRTKIEENDRKYKKILESCPSQNPNDYALIKPTVSYPFSSQDKEKMSQYDSEMSCIKAIIWFTPTKIYGSDNTW